MPDKPQLAVRWTIGDVTPFGFDALRLSAWGAWNIFGAAAEYVVCVNSVPLRDARDRAGLVPPAVRWHASDRDQLPQFLRDRLDGGMSEGVGWKFAPVRLFPERHEIALDNDCILWRLPDSVCAWLGDTDPDVCLIAEDTKCGFGQFAGFCGPAPRNSGIRGLPPRFDYEQALRAMLERHPVMLTTELDEQGLQVAAVSRQRQPRVVSVGEVTICSPFQEHVPNLGLCGAHFIGLNDRHLPWDLHGIPAEEHIRRHWLQLRPHVESRVGIAPHGP